VTRTQTTAVYHQVLNTYVAAVTEGDVAPAVLAAIEDEPTEILYELLDLTWRLGLRGGVESDSDRDAWWDAMDNMLPDVKARLTR
jgi:hypothetical protein